MKRQATHLFQLLLLAFLMPMAFANASEICQEQVGQMMIVRNAHPPADIVGGVLLFKSDFKGLVGMDDVFAKTSALQEGRKTPLFIAIDQEGGLVQRLNVKNGYSDIPTHEEIGEGEQLDSFRWGLTTAAELKGSGINLNFGVVLDVDSNPDNPVISRYKRSLGNDVERVASWGLELVDGSITNDVVPTIKHFPGHGDTSTDSHVGLAVVDKTMDELEQIELAPFETVLGKALRPPAVMMGHISLPKILGSNLPPASLSRDIVTGLLKNKMGHKGLIVTDDLIMGAISKHYSPLEAALMAIEAGNDMLILGPLKTDEQLQLADHICEAAKSNELLRQEIQESFAKIINQKDKYRILDPEDALEAADFYQDDMAEMYIHMDTWNRSVDVEALVNHAAKNIGPYRGPMPIKKEYQPSRKTN